MCKTRITKYSSVFALFETELRFEPMQIIFVIFAHALLYKTLTWRTERYGGLFNSCLACRVEPFAIERFSLKISMKRDMLSMLFLKKNDYSLFIHKTKLALSKIKVGCIYPTYAGSSSCSRGRNLTMPNFIRRQQK